MNQVSKGKLYNNEEAVQKLAKYCAYQERCQQEVDEKLQSWGFPANDRRELIVRLIEQGFLNEERFARAYVRGKFKHNQWGKIKIRQGLKQRGISDQLIKMAFTEIDEREYADTLKLLMKKKAKLIKEKNPFRKTQKLFMFIAGKGFEAELFWEVKRDEL